MHEACPLTSLRPMSETADVTAPIAEANTMFEGSDDTTSTFRDTRAGHGHRHACMLLSGCGASTTPVFGQQPPTKNANLYPGESLEMQMGTLNLRLRTNTNCSGSHGRRRCAVNVLARYTFESQGRDLPVGA